MEGHFAFNSKQCYVKYRDGNLSISEMDSGATPAKIISNKHILKSVCEEDLVPCVVIDHAVSLPNKQIRTETVKLSGDTPLCKTLSSCIESDINALPRPKRLIVFVNPKSGHKKGVKIYTSKVKPLLKSYGVNIVDLIVTERPGQPLDYLRTCDLRLIHGIVSVGGDGMFSECVNGLLRRLQEDSHVNYNDPEALIAASKIPIGIVPAGSGNYLVNYIHGTKDLHTAVLKIILGDHHLSNVVSVHQGRNLTCYASLLFEFGLIGSMMHDCEKFRWMGPSRYNVVPLASLVKRKPVDVSIEYMPEELSKSSSYSTKYLRQVSVPAKNFTSGPFRDRLNSNPQHTVTKRNKSGWKKLDAVVYGVDTYVVTQKEKGDKLVPKFGDNALTMWLTEKCSLPKHVEQLTKLQKAEAGFLKYDFIKKVRTTHYRVKLSSARVAMDENGNRTTTSKFYVNADGEAIRLDTPEFEVKLHPCAMPIYGKMEN